VSTIPAVKAGLVSVWTTALSGALVIYGPLSAVTTTPARVLSVGRVSGTRDSADMSSSAVSETYSIECLVSVAFSGTSQQMAEEQALADYETACDAVNALRPDLGLGAGMTVRALSSFELDEVANEHGRAAQIRFSIQVFAPNT
jgi:hypothetical protein